MSLQQARTMRWEPLAAVLVLVALCTKMLLGLQQHVDIVGGDDAMYTNLGRNLPGKLMPDFAPFYVIWLKVLRVLTGDAITAYYINTRCMVLFPAMALMIFLRRLGMAWWASLLFSGMFICSEVVVHLSWNTYLGHLAAGFLLLWMAWVVKERDPLIILLSGALAALLISYIRPEFFLAFLALSGLSVLIAIWIKWKKRWNWNARLKYLLMVYVLASVLLMGVIGIPLGQDAWRSWVAIFQHIIYNYALRHDLPYPFMESFNMTEYWKIFAGNSTDVKEIVNKNIPEIKAHLAYNFTAYWRLLYDNLGEVLAPRKIFFGAPAWVQWLLIVLVSVGVYLLPAKRSSFISRLKRHGWLLFTLLVICGPGIFFSFLIFPREHYFMAHLPFYLALFFLLVLPYTLFERSSRIALVTVAAGLLILAPTIDKFQYEKIWGPYQKITLVHDLRALSKLPIYDRQIRLLERETNLGAFLKGNCPVWFPYKEIPFDQFIDSNKVDVILVSEAMRLDRQYKNDSTFTGFTKGDYQEEWKKIPVQASGDDIYVRSSLLPAGR